jgi:hypothetical protein
MSTFTQLVYAEAIERRGARQPFASVSGPDYFSDSVIIRGHKPSGLRGIGRSGAVVHVGSEGLQIVVSLFPPGLGKLPVTIFSEPWDSYGAVAQAKSVVDRVAMFILAKS